MSFIVVFIIFLFQTSIDHMLAIQNYVGPKSDQIRGQTTKIAYFGYISLKNGLFEGFIMNSKVIFEQERIQIHPKLFVYNLLKKQGVTSALVVLTNGNSIQYQFIKVRNMEIDLGVLNKILALRNADAGNALSLNIIKKSVLNKKKLKLVPKKDILRLAKTLIQRKNALLDEKSQFNESWMWGEHKFFIWTILYYTHYVGAQFIDINSIAQQQFQIIKALFPLKQPYFLLFQYIDAFCPEKDFRPTWTLEERSILYQILPNKLEQRQWKEISYELFKRSEGKYFKNAESCRNIWVNHINPNISKESWSESEDLKLIDYIAKYGKKWAKIELMITNRTQHMLKNRYRCLLRKFKISEKEKQIEQTCSQILQNLGGVKNYEEMELEGQLQIYETQQNTDRTFELQITKQSKLFQIEDVFSIQTPTNTDQCPLSIDEIIDELNRREFGENYRFINLYQPIETLGTEVFMAEDIDIDCF